MTWCDGDDSKAKCGKCAGCLREQLAEKDRLLETMTRAVQKDDELIADLKAEIERLKGVAAEWRDACGRASDKANFALLQLRERDEEISSLKESLRDVLEISEVEGAVNTTVMESAKLIAARSLLGPESRFAERRNDLFPVEGNPGDVCGPCGVAHPVAEKRECNCEPYMLGHGHLVGCQKRTETA